MTTYINPERKIRWHLAHLATLQAGNIPAAPINVEIDLTNRCSLGCQWCHFAYTHTRGPLAGKRAKPTVYTAGGDVMPLELAKSIMDQLAAAGVQSITWTGGGEPTLHPDFDAIVDYCPLPQGLYTHGGHIDEARAALLKRRMTWVYVSLDEATIGAYKKSKGVDGWERAANGVQRLTQAEGVATIGVGYMLHAGNWQDVAVMRHQAEQFGADYVQFRPAIGYDMEAPGEPTNNGRWIADAYGAVPLSDAPRFLQYGTWRGHGYDICHWTSLQVAITPNGKVWDCVNKREFAGAELGDLSRESWADVWARRGRVRVDETCRVMCRGHVANVAIHDILTPPPHKEFV